MSEKVVSKASIAGDTFVYVPSIDDLNKVANYAEAVDRQRIRLENEINKNLESVYLLVEKNKEKSIQLLNENGIKTTNEIKKLLNTGPIEQAFSKVSADHIKRIDEKSSGIAESLRRSDSIHSAIASSKESIEKLTKKVGDDSAAVQSKLAEAAHILNQLKAIQSEIHTTQSQVKTLAEQVTQDKQSVLAKADSLYAALAEVKTLSDKVAQAEAARNEQAAKLESRLTAEFKQSEASRNSQLNQLQAKLDDKSQQLDASLAKLTQQQAQHASFFGRLKWLFFGN